MGSIPSLFVESFLSLLVDEMETFLLFWVMVIDFFPYEVKMTLISLLVVVERVTFSLGRVTFSWEMETLMKKMTKISDLEIPSLVDFSLSLAPAPFPLVFSLGIPPWIAWQEESENVMNQRKKIGDV